MMRSIPVALLSIVIAGCGADTSGPTATDLSISVTTHDFGAVSLGGQSAMLSLTVANGGGSTTGALGVAISGSHANDFDVTDDQCSQQHIAPGASCRIDIRLTPSAVGPLEASLAVADPQGDRVTAALRGIGSSSGVSVSPTVANFGLTAVGHVGASKAFVVRNTQLAETGLVAVAISSGNAAVFQITRDSCTGRSLLAGESCGIDITFTPDISGTHQAVLSVTAAGGGARPATLIGSAGARTTLGATPADHTFANEIVGAVGPYVDFEISNAGPNTSGSLSITLTGASPADFQVATIGCWAPLASGATCTVQVRFAPTATGMRSATVTIADEYGSVVSMRVSGTGDPTPPAPTLLELSPASSFDFPPTIVEGTTTQLVTVTNPGTTPVGPLVATAQFCDYYCYATDFDVVQDNCSGYELAPGASCSLGVSFTPSAWGSQSALLQVSALDAIGYLSLSGTGNGLHVGTPTLSFPTTAANTTSASQIIVVTNTASATTGAVAATISGDGFEITSNGCAGVSLAPGASCNLSVRFVPFVNGTYGLTLAVGATPGGTVYVSLYGVAY
jgi:hypothetical protein